MARTFSLYASAVQTKTAAFYALTGDASLSGKVANTSHAEALLTGLVKGLKDIGAQDGDTIEIITQESINASVFNPDQSGWMRTRHKEALLHLRKEVFALSQRGVDVRVFDGSRDPSHAQLLRSARDKAEMASIF